MNSFMETRSLRAHLSMLSYAGRFGLMPPGR